MYNITSKYYNKFNNNLCKTFYYKFSNDIKDDYVLENNILLIKGNETYLPGILDKTIKAFSYFKDYKYDYLVRSNISTIINLDLLINQLNKNNIDYGGGTVLYIDEYYLDPSSGINDNRYVNTFYASGTSIVLSKNLVNQILLKKEFIDYNVIDDVAIGFLIKNYFSDIYLKLYNFNEKFISINDDNINNFDISKIIFYRNRNITRDIDIKNIDYITSILY